MRRTAVFRKNNVGEPVVIQVGNRHSPRGVFSGEGGAGLIADVFHSSALDITQQEKWLAVSYSTTAFIDCIVGMTIRQDQIEPSVIVVIEETQTPSTEH